MCGVCVFLVMFALCAVALDYLNAKLPSCFEEHKIVSIQSTHYRSATFLLEDGQLVDIDQSTLSPGDVICTKRLQY